MLKGLGDIGNLMKMQREFKATQKKITSARISGESTAGEVRATMSGEYKLLEIVIDPSFIRDADVKKVEKMIALAVNNAVVKVKDFSAEEMGKLTGGLDMSALGNMLK